MMYKVLFYNGGTMEVFHCVVIAGLCFNCFSCGEDFPYGFNLNFNNPTPNPTQQAFPGVFTNNRTQVSNGFNPTQQGFGAVITNNWSQLSKGFNTTQQAFGAVITNNWSQLSNTFNPTHQSFGPVITNNRSQLFNGFNPTRQAFRPVDTNRPELYNAFNPTQKAFAAVDTNNNPQVSNSFPVNFIHPLSPFLQEYKDPYTNKISLPVPCVKDPLLPPFLSNEKQLSSKDDDTQNNLKQRLETLGNGNYKTIAEARENGGKRLEERKGVFEKAAGALGRDGSGCVVGGDNGRLLLELREPESFPRLQKQRFNFPLPFQAPIKFRSNTFNTDWSGNNVGIDLYGIQHMATVSDSKKGLFDRDLINNNGFNEFRNVYNGGEQTQASAYNSLMNEYYEKASTIPAVEENTPHITHNVDRIAHLNRMIELELNGPATTDNSITAHYDQNEFSTSLKNGAKQNSKDFSSEDMNSSTPNEGDMVSIDTGTTTTHTVIEETIQANTFGDEAVEATVQKGLGHVNTNIIDRITNKTEVNDKQDNKHSKNLKKLKQTSKQIKKYEAKKESPLKPEKAYYNEASKCQISSTSHNHKNDQKSKSKPKVMTTRNPEECIRKIKELLANIEPSTTRSSTICQRRQEQIRKRKRDRDDTGISSQTNRKKVTTTYLDKGRIFVKDEIEAKTWGSCKGRSPSNNMSALSLERKYSKIDVKFNEDKSLTKDKNKHSENSKIQNKRKQHVLKEDNIIRQCKHGDKDKKVRDKVDEDDTKHETETNNQNDELRKYLQEEPEEIEDQDNEIETCDEDDENDMENGEDNEEYDEENEEEDDSDEIENKIEESILKRLSDKFNFIWDKIDLDRVKSHPEWTILGVLSVLVFILVVVFVLVRIFTKKQNPFETGGFTVVRLNVQPRHDTCMMCHNQNHSQFGQQVFNCHQCQDGHYQSNTESGSTVLRALYMPDKKAFAKLSEASVYCTVNPHLNEQEISSRRIIHGKRINKSSTN
ncbi:hypothetical protein WDU94_001581 [Cyamophila willieti]